MKLTYLTVCPSRRFDCLMAVDTGELMPRCNALRDHIKGECPFFKEKTKDDCLYYSQFIEKIYREYYNREVAKRFNQD